jgi:hypothetical protein
VLKLSWQEALPGTVHERINPAANSIALYRYTVAISPERVSVGFCRMCRAAISGAPTMPTRGRPSMDVRRKEPGRRGAS